MKHIIKSKYTTDGRGGVTGHHQEARRAMIYLAQRAIKSKHRGIGEASKGRPIAHNEPRKRKEGDLAKGSKGFYKVSRTSNKKKGEKASKIYKNKTNSLKAKDLRIDLPTARAPEEELDEESGIDSEASSEAPTQGDQGVVPLASTPPILPLSTTQATNLEGNDVREVRRDLTEQFEVLQQTVQRTLQQSIMQMQIVLQQEMHQEVSRAVEQMKEKAPGIGIQPNGIEESRSLTLEGAYEREEQTPMQPKPRGEPVPLTRSLEASSETGERERERSFSISTREPGRSAQTNRNEGEDKLIPRAYLASMNLLDVEADCAERLAFLSTCYDMAKCFEGANDHNMFFAVIARISPEARAAHVDPYMKQRVAGTKPSFQDFKEYTTAGMTRQQPHAMMQKWMNQAFNPTTRVRAHCALVKGYLTTYEAICHKVGEIPKYTERDLVSPFIRGVLEPARSIVHAKQSTRSAKNMPFSIEEACRLVEGVIPLGEHGNTAEQKKERIIRMPRRVPDVGGDLKSDANRMQQAQAVEGGGTNLQCNTVRYPRVQHRSNVGLRNESTREQERTVRTEAALPYGNPPRYEEQSDEEERSPRRRQRRYIYPAFEDRVPEQGQLTNVYNALTLPQEQQERPLDQTRNPQREISRWQNPDARGYYPASRPPTNNGAPEYGRNPTQPLPRRALPYSRELPRQPPMALAYPRPVVTNPNYPPSYRPQSNMGVPPTCYSCNMQGHTSRECEIRRQQILKEPAKKFRCAACDVAGPCTPTCVRRLTAQSKGQVEAVFRGRSHYFPIDRRPEYIPEQAVIRPSSTGRPPQMNCHAVQTIEESPKDQAQKEIEDGNGQRPKTKGVDPLKPMKNKNKLKSDTKEYEGAELRVQTNVRQPRHTRAIVQVSGISRIAIIDTGADACLIAEAMVLEEKGFKAKNPDHTVVKGIGDHAVACVGTLSLLVEIGPLKVRAGFFVIRGLHTEVILGADFLYEHGITVSPYLHALVLEHHQRTMIPLMGMNPRFVTNLCVNKGCALQAGNKCLIDVRTCTVKDILPGCAQEVFNGLSTNEGEGLLVERSMHEEWGVIVPLQVTQDRLEICYVGSETIWLPKGYPIGYALGIKEGEVQLRAELHGLRTEDPRHSPPCSEAKSHRSKEVNIRNVRVLNETRTPTVETRLSPSTEPEKEREQSTKAKEQFTYTTDGCKIPQVQARDGGLKEQEAKDLNQLLIEYEDRFNDGSRPIGVTNLVTAHLDTGSHPPISIPPRRLAPILRQEVRQIVAELDAAGITEPGMGNWSVPIVLVKKKTGSWRLCCDYRETNKFVCVPQQPLPRIDDILASFKGKRYFTVLDMYMGFHQIEVAPEDRPKTAFVTPDCQRQFRRLPFGFASSPAIFQNMVNLLLGGMKWVFAIGYIDDIIIFSDNWEDHVAHLRQLFDALRAANLQLSPQKCTFGCATVKYLGHVVSREGISVNPEYISAVRNFPVPINAKAVQRFIGKCQYYHRFVPNFSKMCAPLYKATRANITFDWNKECQRAFEELRDALTSCQVLAHPDYSRPFIIDCDGSQDGLGATLIQDQGKGERPIAYISRTLGDYEKKWTATEIEAAAVMWALERFRPYIYGIRVLVRTDHSPLEYLRKCTNKCARLERWALKLQEFQFDIQHRPGAQQKHVDALSRAPVEEDSHLEQLDLEQFPERAALHASYVEERAGIILRAQCLRKKRAQGGVLAPKIKEQWQQRAHQAAKGAACVRHLCLRKPPTPQTWKCLQALRQTGDDSEEEEVIVELSEGSDMEEDAGYCPEAIIMEKAHRLPQLFPNIDIKEAQEVDEDCNIFKAYIGRDSMNPQRQPHKPEMNVVKIEEVICVQFGDQPPRIMLPKTFRDQVMHAHHLSYYAGHFGVTKTTARIMQRYWWPGMRAQVRAFINQCPFCLSYRRLNVRNHWLSMPVGTPFEVVAMDIFGPLPKTRRNNTHILVLIDHHTRWIECQAMTEPTARKVAEILFQRWISRWGVMRVLLTDNGPQFTASVLKQLTEVYGIKKVFSSPYNPAGNSIVESFMRSLKSALVLCIQQSGLEWDRVLAAAEMAYRSTPHLTTKRTPFFLVTGQEMILPLSRQWMEPCLYQMGANWLETLWMCRQQVMAAHAAEAQRRLELFNEHPGGLIEGAWVAVRLNEVERSKYPCMKFAPQYKAPYVITEVCPLRTTFKVKCPITGAEQVVNRSKLKFCAPPTVNQQVAIPLPRSIQN